MQIIRTIVWVLVLVALLVFAINNWTPVSVKIWEGLILETKLPALVIVSFLVGLVPMWLLHQGMKWRLERRINGLENTMRSASAALAPSPAIEPVQENQIEDQSISNPPAQEAK
ncbi:hypothetical protein MB02_12905 [Croceicoccus estronivorus]|uniref:lipopolysaccharide assembly protein LapA domain-containing protein n=1 Tax=Croceicoccus estronivorus TaxID=1172626 RepID=UPI00082B1F8C|nr:lipopolysaccharide assembly protein LapA domain-containing protein [Croceicoccus estronivorus]OCC23070.1 hypothetical protein MB02_12905 [Croceicoccus estronivorus]